MAGTDTIAGSTATTATLTFGKTTSSEINTGGDQDWFRVMLTAGSPYTFQLSGAGSAPLSDSVLELRNAAGTIIATDDDAGPGLNSFLSTTVATSGTYYLGVRGIDTSALGAYLVSAEDSYAPTEAISSLSSPKAPLAGGTTIYFYFEPAGIVGGYGPSVAWSGDEATAVSRALGEFSKYLPVNFVETTDPSLAYFKLYQINNPSAPFIANMGAAGTASQGVGTFNRGSISTQVGGLEPGSNGFAAYLHEFGHGLGLGHTHDSAIDGKNMLGVASQFNSFGIGNLNQTPFTVMSYNSGWATGPNGNASGVAYGDAATLSPLDIYALQQKYGARDANIGNTIYELSTSNGTGTGYRAIWDTAGVDTIKVSGNTGAIIDLRSATNLYDTGGGGFVSWTGGVYGGFTIAYGVVIENATGGGGLDRLTGNEANNVLDGGFFEDEMTGGLGDDLYFISTNFTDIQGFLHQDKVFENANEGNDTVATLVEYSLAALPDVENIRAIGAFNVAITGNDRDNVLEGSTGAGVNVMTGGLGNDTYYLGVNDSLVEDANGDTADTVYVDDFAYSLVGKNVERGIMLGTHPVMLGGTDFADYLNGELNPAANFLEGVSGDDTYVLGAGDYVGEQTWEGTDVIQSSTISLNINAYNNIENAALLGSAALNLTGSSGANTLTGNSGNNIINGGGGLDTMAGGVGNDTYYVDGLDDVVNEAIGLGTQDTIISTVNIRLDTTATAQGVEHVVLQGSAAATVIGTSVFNIITGNTGNNYLAGYGGNDTVNGGAGNDTVFGGDGKDTLAGGLGNDKFLYSFIADSGGTQPRRDVITDFGQAAGNNDWIDLALTDANGALANNQAFVWRGTAAFTGAAGELRYFQDAANNRTIIEGNVRIDAASPGPEFSIELTGLKTLTAGTTNAFDIIL